MAKKKIKTLDDLAAVTHKEFLVSGKRMGALENRVGSLESKVGGLEGKVGSLEVKVDSGFKAIAEVLDLMRADIRDIKVTLPPLIRSQGALEGEVGDLKNRVARLERKVGLPR